MSLYHWILENAKELVVGKEGEAFTVYAPEPEEESVELCDKCGLVSAAHCPGHEDKKSGSRPEALYPDKVDAGQAGGKPAQHQPKQMTQAEADELDMRNFKRQSSFVEFLQAEGLITIRDPEQDKAEALAAIIKECESHDYVRGSWVLAYLEEAGLYEKAGGADDSTC